MLFVVDLLAMIGPWSNWTVCEKSCGGGFQFRTRACDPPLPFTKALCAIHGGNEERRLCNTDVLCPGVFGYFKEWSTLRRQITNIQSERAVYGPSIRWPISQNQCLFSQNALIDWDRKLSNSAKIIAKNRFLEPQPPFKVWFWWKKSLEKRAILPMKR